jgi:hypothetical protein
VSTNDYSFGVRNPTIDLFVQKQFPAIILSGTEVNALTTELIELSGTTWIVTNAIYNPVLSGFQQQNTSIGSSALLIAPDGTLSQAVAGPGAAVPIVWTFTVIQGAKAVYTGIFNVQAYGATGTSTPTATTQGIQAAINACNAAGGGIVLLPQETYTINGPLTVPDGAGIQITGQTRRTFITQTTANDIFQIENTQGTIINLLHLQYNSTSLAGRGISANGANNVRLNEILVGDASVGFYFFDTNDVQLFQCTTQSSTNSEAGLWIDGGANGDGGCTLFLADACTFSGTNGPGIMLGHCQTLRFSNTQVLGFDVGVDIGNPLVVNNPDRVNPGGTIQTQLIYCSNVDVNQGMADYGFYLHPPSGWTVVDVRLMECHAEVHPAQGGAAVGFMLTQDPTTTTYGLIDTVQIQDCTATFCGTGLHLQAGKNIEIVGGVYAGNAQIGVSIDGSLSGVVLTTILVVGIRAGQKVGGGAATQNIGVQVSATVDDIMVIGCDLLGNQTHNLNVVGGYAAAFGDNSFIINCNGYNPVGLLTPPGFPLTTVPQQNFYPFPVEVYLSGGSVTDVHIKGPNDATGVDTGLTSGAFTLQPGESIVVSYTGSPSWAWKGD